MNTIRNRQNIFLILAITHIFLFPEFNVYVQWGAKGRMLIIGLMYMPRSAKEHTFIIYLQLLEINFYPFEIYFPLHNRMRYNSGY
jgi:hypothetical protein